MKAPIKKEYDTIEKNAGVSEMLIFEHCEDCARGGVDY